MARSERGRARRGSGSITRRGDRHLAKVDLGVGADGRRVRPSKTFETREEAQTWIDQKRANTEELVRPVANRRLDEYLRWWLEHEAPKGRPGRRPLASTTLEGYRVNIEKHSSRHSRVGGRSPLSSRVTSRGAWSTV